LAGLRHRAVLIVLDHPSRADLVLMQVRSPNKLESPGCFDLPVAGHVPGLSTPEAALSAEMAQELGLRPGDVADLRLIGAYDAPPPDAAAPRCNAEYRLVFGGRAAQGLAERVWFSDGEVAALAIFSRAELRALVATQPGRAAPGLAESLPLFDGGAAPEIAS
jgi:8-oxo-dGTP pyrophosphatase MutT (NUDIX family)